MSRTIEERKEHYQHMIEVNQEVIEKLDNELRYAEGAQHARLQREVILASNFVDELIDMMGALVQEEMEQEERECGMFGMTIKSMNEQRESEGICRGDTQMWAITLLSDAQHAIENGANESARLLINQAKYWIAQTRKERK